MAHIRRDDRATTCLIAGDHPLAIESLTEVLAAEGINVLAHARSGAEALALLEQHRATVIVLDVRLSDTSGIEVARSAVHLAPDTAVIIYTSETDPALVRRAVDAGARGVVRKDATPVNLLQAIAVVAAGGTFVDPSLELSDPVEPQVASRPPRVAAGRRRIVERLALGGMALATVALGALALWSSIATQNTADDLSKAGIQTSGHLRAVQSLSSIDTETDALEEGLDAARLVKMRKAQQIFEESLDRMEKGGLAESVYDVRVSRPHVRRLWAAIDEFLLAIERGDDERVVVEEDEMEELMGDIQVELNDVDHDPSSLLTTKLEEVNALERTVRNSTLVLVPIGLLFVLLASWVLTRAFRALVRSEERLEFAQRVARMGVWDQDVQTGEATWSSSLLDLFGLDREAEQTYDEFLTLIHPDDRARVEESTKEAVTRGGDYELEHRIVRADGELPLLTRARAIHDENGKPMRVLGVSMDVSEQREAAAERDKLTEQLRQAQRLEAVGRLAGGVAHDFNNILLGIRGYGELAHAAIARDEAPSVEIDEIVAAADRAAALTKQLLAFSRKQVMKPEILDLNDVVVEMEGLLSRLIGEDIELVSVAAGEPVCVNADRGQLGQVLADLAANARDAMVDGGRLTLEVGTAELTAEHGIDVAAGGYAVLAVSDTGAGMAPEVSSQIFEPFFTTKPDGTGLGLATVHGVVEQSGGSIWVYSEVGHGTTFKIYLPLAKQAPPAASAAAPPSNGGSGRTILLVEDDPHVQTVMHRMLARLDYTVLPARDGDEALALAGGAGVHIDLLLTDLVMPGLGGREVAARFRELHVDASVLYMSGYTDDSVIRRGAIEPGTAFLHKPFSSKELARTLDLLLAPAGREETDQSESASETVLVVEDDASVRKLVRHVLEGRGYTVLDAADLDEAVTTAATHTSPIDLLLTDVALPSADGFEVADQVTAGHPKASVLFMSGQPAGLLVDLGLGADNLGFVQKPFTADTLVRRVRETLDSGAG